MVWLWFGLGSALVWLRLGLGFDRLALRKLRHITVTVCYGKINPSKKNRSFVQRTKQHTKLHTSVEHKAAHIGKRAIAQSTEHQRTESTHKAANSSNRTSQRTKRSKVCTRICFYTTP